MLTGPGGTMENWRSGIPFIVLCSIFLSATECCEKTADCGWKSDGCIDISCVCPDGYKIHTNGRDCISENCTASPDCLDCKTEYVCSRCVHFIDEGSRNCIDKCSGEAKFIYDDTFQGSVCFNIRQTDNTDIIIGIVAGVSAGLLLCVIVTLLFFFYMKRTRRNVDLYRKTYDSGSMQMGNVKTVPVYDNRGYESDNFGSLHQSVDRDAYLKELDKLRPHVATLLTLLNQIRYRLRAMSDRDARVPTYKGVIHQLCRVLVLLHKKEPGSSIPSDALGLLEWAQQMLEDYRQETQEHSTSGSFETGPAAKISYVDVPEFPNNSKENSANQYTVPHTGQREITLQNTCINPLALSHTKTGLYSSVPVPVDMCQNGVSADHFPITQKPSQNSDKRKTKARLFKQRSNSSKNVNEAVVCVTGSLPMGYFANGRFYDPQSSTEVYAPASSYSDRSNQMLSTFMGDNQYSRSASVSGSSIAVGEMDEDETRSENDVFPFDPKDATAPMEV